MSPPDVPPNPIQQLRTRFATLADPRVERTKDHHLLDILTITVCAVICGADNWVDIEAFGRSKRAFLEQFLALPNGIPSHDTFGRVFARLNPEQFQTCFQAWVQDLITASGDQLRGVVALDGKCLCGSRAAEQGKGPLYLVSAWAEANRLVLGQVAVDEKSNEITAIPALLKLLDLTGCIVTIDAMGCQTAIARQIREAAADYVLALKGNQGRLHDDVGRLFAEGLAAGGGGVAHATEQTLNKGHGRVERRRYCLITDARYLDYVNPQGAWVELRGLGMVETERRMGEVVSREQRYYITSLDDVAEFAGAVRGHWGIENKLHWVLDVAFREDENRTRSGDSAQNLSMVRHWVLNMLRQDKTSKASLKTKRLRAGWDEDYLLRVLRG